MAYIGRVPQVGNYFTLDAISTSSTATYNLLKGGVAYVPETAYHLIVSLNGVIQAPITAYTVSGSTITFASTLSASDSIDFITVLGDTLAIGTPSDGTVAAAQIAGTLDLSSKTVTLPAASVTAHVTQYDDNKIQSNIALLGFKTAVNGSLAVYNLVDQVVDEYTDATGIDASASTNENLTSGYYRGAAVTTPSRTHDADQTGVDGDYTWFKWTDTGATGSFSTNIAQTAEWLVVAGGGGGAGDNFGGGVGGSRGVGGGGAGGLRTSYGSTSGGGASAEADLNLGAGTTYTITVGAGGSAGTDNGQVAGSGSASSIAGSDITDITTVGGGGGSPLTNNGATGGSGGGGGNGTNGGAGTANQGYAGGNSAVASNQGSGGGGGGASSAGTAGSSSYSNGGGAGGNGLSVSITGSAVVYAAGGGGGRNSSGSDNGGSSGVGGNGGNTGNGTAGDVNTGSGGGGSGGVTNTGSTTGGAGGSGVVILRIPTANYSGTVSGSPTVTTDGDFKVVKFTGSGSYTG